MGAELTNPFVRARQSLDAAVEQARQAMTMAAFNEAAELAGQRSMVAQIAN